MAAEQHTSPLKGTVVFTGRLASIKRAEAAALVRESGGTPRRGLTRKTDVLVVGALGWPLLLDGRASKSLALAKTYGVAVASERQFLEWAGRAVPDEQVRTYSAEQLGALSGLPRDVIDELTAFGLIDCRDGRYGFRDLTAARQLAELFAAGVALSTVTRSLHEIRKWLPDAALSNLRLYPAASDALLVEHVKGRTDRRGQYVLPVGEAGEDPDDLFEQAQVAEEGGDIATAQRLYGKVMRIDPKDPIAAFNLGNILRSTGRKVEAEAAYRASTKADPRFAEAWYNLADLLDNQGRSDQAIECLERALAIDPRYADAIFNLALMHQRADRPAEAAACWQRYLALDNASPWAARARRALKYCQLVLAAR